MQFRQCSYREQMNEASRQAGAGRMVGASGIVTATSPRLNGGHRSATIVVSSPITSAQACSAARRRRSVSVVIASP
jgi:hypothetical protein